ncbi:entericidin [Ciceribacter naphthalenivorans]|uniref:Entericidin n=2 Tax=Alphaproteobacteria TaxID=28211 RepID=A0A512HD63_9HYPH|nr:entericidin [Sphingomonas psychrolutea]GEO83391.1 entericidin [Ciceribacter naphthalenivorans]GLR23036.1 entericidin [Ciceribacter naphthalenivorans]GLT05892.1 entericidin [Sphingomonas psychrolutea]
MNTRKLTLAVVLMASAFGLSSCGNTIRGIGKDTANTVNATQQAGQDVGNAAK